MKFRTKTILGIAVIEVALLAVLITHTLSMMRDVAGRELNARAESTASLLAATAKDAVLSYDLATLRAFVAEVMTQPDVLFVAVADAAGRPLGFAHRHGVDRPAQVSLQAMSAIADDAILSSAEVAEGGVSYGNIVLGLSPSVAKAMFAEARRSALLIAGIEVLLVALFSWLLGTYLTRNLYALRDGAGAIATGDLSHRIPSKGHDEMAETIAMFNQMAQALHDLNVYRDVVLSSTFDCVFVLDKSLVIESVNHNVVRQLGFPEHEVLGRRLDTLLSDFRLPEATAVPLTEMPVDRQFEARVQCADGGYKDVEIAIASCEVPNTTIRYTAYVRDISERRAHERMRSEFLSTVSHELRTPVTAIVGALGLVLDDAFREKTPTKDLVDVVAIAHRNGHRLSSLINDLLDLQKINAGKMRYHLESLDVGTLLTQISEEMAPNATRAGVRLVHESGASAQVVRVDRGRLVQAVVNLVANAIKYSPKEGEVRLGSTSDGHDVIISVQDHGPGIPEVFHDRIFDAFTQADASDTRAYAGTGLGLTISQKIITAMRGRIWFETSASGTTFFIALPLTESSILPDSMVAGLSSPRIAPPQN